MFFFRTPCPVDIVHHYAGHLHVGHRVHLHVSHHGGHRNARSQRRRLNGNPKVWRTTTTDGQTDWVRYVLEILACKKRSHQTYLMKESKFLGLHLNSKPNSCMQLWNQFSLMFQPRDIFFDILSMSFPHSHRWYLSARSWLPLLGSWKLKQKLVWQKNEYGLVHLILCSQKALIEMLYSALVCVLHCCWQYHEVPGSLDEGTRLSD